MKQSSIKRILIPIMLVLTLTAMLVCVSAAETETVQNPTAKLTVTSVKTGETIETLYEIAEAAFYAAEQEAQSHDKTVTVTLLAPQKGYTFACGLSYFTCYNRRSSFLRSVRYQYQPLAADGPSGKRCHGPRC